MLMLTLAASLQAATGGSPLALAADLALTIIAVAIVAVAVMSGILMFRFNRILAEIQRSTRQNFGPVSDRARSISDNVEFITQALRTDVEKLNASVRSLSDRLQEASDRLEERVEEFNALMSVVQGEAEDIFLDTASTVRGVREGARVIGGGPSREGRPGSGPSTEASQPPGLEPDDADSDLVEGAAPPADDSSTDSVGED